MWKIIGPSVLIALVIFPRLAVAADQSGEDALKALRVDGVITWMEWWETNRDTYLRKLLEKQRLHAVVPPKDIKAKVVARLLEATHDGSRDVRAEAALALARMGEGSDRLLELTRDSDQRVQCRAWVGLGLLQNEAALLNAGKLDDAQTLAVVTGLGLLDKPSGKAVDFLRLAARTASYAEAQRMAIWALRVYHNLNLVDDKKGIDESILLELVKTSDNPAVVSEALLAMGTIGDRDNLPLLTDVARLGDQTMAKPAFARFMKDSLVFGSERAVAISECSGMRAAACLAVAQLKESTKKPVPATPLTTGVVDPKMPSALSVMQHNAFERGHIIAQVGPNVWCEPIDFYPGISVLALNRLGDSKSILTLLQFAVYPPITAQTGSRNGKPVFQTMFDPAGVHQPQRGYAAIAMGLSGSSDWLHTYANKPDEPRHLRAACVLAMGLTGDKGNAETLMHLADKLDPKSDVLIYGHIVLALGMMHDPHTLEYAGKFGLGGAKSIDVNKVLRSDFDISTHLDVVPEIPLIEDMDDVFGVRAALLGLAVFGDDAAKPALLNCWGHGQWVSLEAARAMGWCGVYDGVDPMLALLRQTNQKNVQAWTARCLGEIFDPNQPSNLSRLVEGNLYVCPVKFTDGRWIDLPPSPIGTQREYRAMLIEREFHGLGNSFLYWYILPHPMGHNLPPWQQ